MSQGRIHLCSVDGYPSCSQRGVVGFTQNSALVTCKFCRAIITMRLTRHTRVFTTQEWTRCRLRNNDVWAQSVGGVIVADDDGTVVVTSDPHEGRRYRAHRNALLLVSR